MASPDRLRRWLRVFRQMVEGIGLLEVLAVALVIRAVYVINAGFPLNDGGLFYVIASDIQANGYALPAFTSYNDGSIPLAYPPLAFYLAAVVDHLTPLSLLDTIWLLPLVESVALVAAFYLLARLVLRDRWAVLLATLGFALIPRSFIWLIMGGGLTRGLALALALLALHEARRASIERRWRPAVHSTVLVALTVLTTLETAAFLIASLPLFVLFPLERRRVAMLGAIGAGALALTSPWWGLVLWRHGLDPFLAASEYGGSVIGGSDVEVIWWTLVNPVQTGEPFFPLIGALGVLGGVYALVRGDWLLPVWWALIVAMGTRAFPTLAAVPIAMLAGVALQSVIWPALVALDSSSRAGGMSAGVRGLSTARVLAIGAVGSIVLLFAVRASLEHQRGDQQYLRALTPAEVSAMEWVADQTPPDARFLVLSRNGWYADRDAEWFPALAERESVATVQGYEWVDGEFSRRLGLQSMVQVCVPSANAGSCIDALERLTGFDYIYVPDNCCTDLRQAITGDWRYRVLYDDGAMVLRRTFAPFGPPADSTPAGVHVEPEQRPISR